MLDKTTVAKALQSMEARGMISRAQNARNRRENVIQISEAGKASVSASIHIYDAWLADVCADLSGDGTAARRRLLRKGDRPRHAKARAPQISARSIASAAQILPRNERKLHDKRTLGNERTHPRNFSYAAWQGAESLPDRLEEPARPRAARRACSSPSPSLLPSPFGSSS